MQKVLATGLLAICAIAFTQQQASAWINSRLSMGFNWEHQSGGNSILWGVWKNGQPGAPDTYLRHCPPHTPYYGSPVTPYYPPAPVAPYGYGYPMQFEPSYAAPMMLPTSQPYQQSNYLRPLPYYYGR